MAKSKETDETVTPGTLVKADAESVVVTENPVPEVKRKARKYKVLGGKYRSGPNTVYFKDDIVESEDDLIAIWGRPKFELVEG